MPTYPYTLTMLSPVHIGSGEELEPSEYIVTREELNGQTQYIVDVIDLPAFLASLTPDARRRFDAAVSGSVLHPLRRFIRENCDPKRFRRYWCSTSGEFYERYMEGLQDDRCRLIVNRMMRTGLDSRPYIPGSSLKGAIRTALINQAARLKRIASGGRQDRDFEPLALDYMNQRGRGEIRADPFRAVKVTDAPLPPDAISIDPSKIFKPGADGRSGDPAGIQMYHEMTSSAPDKQEITAAGTIAIDERLARTKVRNWDFEHCVSRPITIHQLLQACNEFYGARLREEHEKFYRKRGDLEEFGSKLLKMVEAMKGNQALVRLGRFSHFECVTIGGYARNPKRGAGATRTLAAGELPMGWARLTVEGIGR